MKHVNTLYQLKVYLFIINEVLSVKEITNFQKELTKLYKIQRMNFLNTKQFIFIISQNDSLY